MQPLVDELHRQRQELSILSEIILIDDASEDIYRQQNRKLRSIATYHELKQNVGRSKIRNLFLDYAQYDYLLFLDGDSVILNPYFISEYIQAIQLLQSKIICGGRKYPEKSLGREKMLRWKYGTKRETIDLLERKKHPNRSFMTNNFIIEKNILKKIKFDETLINYGHEDTLFGFELKKRGITIQHISNEVLHGDIENNHLYLKKTDDGIRNLVRLFNENKENHDFLHEVHLLRFFNQMNDYHIIIVIPIFFFITKTIIRHLLLHGFISLRMFDYYKLALFIRLLNQTKKERK